MFEQHWTPPPFQTVLPYSTHNQYTLDNTSKVDSRASLYQNRFLLRTNYIFRSKIAHLIHKFHHKNGLTAQTRCMAVQVRRGDRAKGSIHNITSLCLNASRPITLSNPVNICERGPGDYVDCKYVVADQGCERRVPLAAVTLDMAIRAGETMVAPEVRHLFVFTDDESWAESERDRVRALYPQWTVSIFEAPKQPVTGLRPEQEKLIAYHDHNTHKGYHYMRSAGGSASGAFFLGSLQLTQQCEGFAGHFTSGVPPLFVKAMCYRHGNGKRHGVCPPVYDTGSGEY
jgi:hypothetical protein